MSQGHSYTLIVWRTSDQRSLPITSKQKQELEQTWKLRRSWTMCGAETALWMFWPPTPGQTKSLEIRHCAPLYLPEITMHTSPRPSPAVLTHACRLVAAKVWEGGWNNPATCTGILYIQSHDHHMIPHDHHMTITWPSHDHHMPLP